MENNINNYNKVVEELDRVKAEYEELKKKTAELIQKAEAFQKSYEALSEELERQKQKNAELEEKYRAVMDRSGLGALAAMRVTSLKPMDSSIPPHRAVQFEAVFTDGKTQWNAAVVIERDVVEYNEVEMPEMEVLEFKDRKVTIRRGSDLLTGDVFFSGPVPQQP